MKSERISRLRDKQIELVRRAKAGLPKDEEGGVDGEKLIEALIEIMPPIDVNAAQRARAVAVLEGSTRPGGGKVDGQLILPGCEPFDWEPYAQIEDAEGKYYDRISAPVKAYQAEADRARVHVDHAVKWLNVKAQQASIFSQWALDEALKGRPRRELTWGNCIIETAILHPKAA
jgi:hypothetical protein